MQEIQQMKDLFYRAHSAVSFSPEVRAASCVNDFSSELAADLAELGDNAGNYKAKYLEHVRTWAERKSRTMSSMITGPARFPVDSNRKKMDAEMRAWDEFRAWRARYIKRANAEPTKSPEEEIDDAVQRLEKQRNHHAMMLGINKILRSKATLDEKKRMIADEYGLNDKLVEKVFEPDCFGGIGFASYQLTNSNATIKRLEEKILTMKARIQNRDKFEEIIFDGGSINIENDRVTIRHDAKPARAVIDELKAHGFRWAPSVGCWCRKHTANAVYDAKKICKVV